MKIKKKELRKRQPQLPINYPDPEVLPEAVPGAAIDVVAELAHVDVLCKRLAHNEVVVRDAALADVPRYLQRMTQPMQAMERDYADEVRSTRAYYRAHPHADRLYHYDNLPLALARYRAQAHKRAAAAQRRDELRALRERRAAEAQARATHGRFALPSAKDDGNGSDDGECAVGSRSVGGDDHTCATVVTQRGEEAVGERVRRARYELWMRHWCDVELVFLKLSRGIYYCLWHSDKPLVQLSCAERIASLLHAPCTTRCKVLFYGALLRVLSREWPTLDHYRLDKYLALVRKMLYTLFVFVATVADEDVGDGDDADAASAAHTTTYNDKNDTVGSVKVDGIAAATSDDAATVTSASRKRTRAEAGNVVVTQRSVDGIVAAYTTTRFARQPVLCEVLRMLCFLLHQQLVPVAGSVGMTMHMCDVAFDELCRAQLPARLFVSLSVVLPLYAMSCGNYVEKRVLDNFFPPIVGGTLLQRRSEQQLQLQLQQQQQQQQRATGKARADARVAAEATARAEAATYTQHIIVELAQCCKSFAVARGTVAAVRVLFSEAELVLRQNAQPEGHKLLTRSAQHRRIAHELDEVNTVRRHVKDARDAMRAQRRQRAREATAASRQRRGEDGDGDGNDTKGAAKQTKRRDTKRKKHYKLTRDDLYGDADSDGEADGK